ncbi:MAG: hypothetical protein K2H53_04935, partial [Clostridia bacterium]|nr:hypothetical protein [Clostridia bacterium]
MEFYPFFGRPYYYTQNRYANSPYRNMQSRRQNSSLQGESEKLSQAFQKTTTLQEENKRQNRGFGMQDRGYVKPEEKAIFE